MILKKLSQQISSFPFQFSHQIFNWIYKIAENLGTKWINNNITNNWSIFPELTAVMTNQYYHLGFFISNVFTTFLSFLSCKVKLSYWELKKITVTAE